MTKQEIFDTVLTHLRKQGGPSWSAGDGCRYRGLDGTSCAVGCLIPDELYDPLIEGVEVGLIFEAVVPYHLLNRAQELLPIYGRIANHLGAEHSLLLHELQEAHDIALFSSGLAAWEEEMRRIARDFGLQYTPA